MNPIATTSRKLRLSPPQLPPLRLRGGASPVAPVAIASAQQGKSGVKPQAAPFPQKETRDMIKSATRKLPFAIWRNGRPRYVPSPAQRKLGFTSRDLKHPNGSWFSLDEAEAELLRIQAEAVNRKQQRAEGLKLPKPAYAPTLGRSLSQIADDFFKLPECQGKPIVEGKRRRKPLSSVTVDGYEKYARLVQQACQRLDDDDTWNMPVMMIGPARMQNLINEIERHSGLHQARKAREFLSTLWSKLASRQPGALKGLFLELDKMPIPEGRLRPWEPREFWHMVQTADAMARPEMADMFFWGLLHGDRQTDRLNPTVIERTSSHITLKHSKTGVITTKLIEPWLHARLAASALRRKPFTVQWPQLMIDEQARRPWHPSGNHYAHVFTAIRAQAAKTMPSLLQGTHGLGIRDQDLRDTNQTWADRASIAPETIALMAGHSLGKQSDMQRKHYIAQNQQRLDNAVLALSHMLTQTAPKPAQEIEG
jgi:hypothetical protein